MNDWISYDNPITLENISLFDKTLEVMYKDKYLQLRWTGDVKFFTDTNEVGHYWEDYSSNVEFESLDEETSEILKSPDFFDVEDYALEWVAKYEYRELKRSHEYY